MALFSCTIKDQRIAFLRFKYLFANIPMWSSISSEYCLQSTMQCTKQMVQYAPCGILFSLRYGMITSWDGFQQSLMGLSSSEFPQIRSGGLTLCSITSETDTPIITISSFFVITMIIRNCAHWKSKRSGYYLTKTNAGMITFSQNGTFRDLSSNALQFQLNFYLYGANHVRRSLMTLKIYNWSMPNSEYRLI